MRPDSPGVRFYKMSGCGNDFIAVTDSDYLSPERIEKLCARGLSLGADGVFALSKVAGRDQAARMDYFNADGTEAGLCVNGARCAGELAFHLGWAEERLALITGAGELRASRPRKGVVTLELPPPAAAQSCAVELEEVTVEGWFLDTGVPHFVLEWPESMIEAPVATLGADIRHAGEFEPAGTNVNFVRFLGPNRLEIRSFERGVESETLACGTGVLAAAAVGVELGRGELPITALTSGGFEIEVVGSVDGAGAITAWSLTGDARLIAEGELASSAVDIPSPPLWAP